MTELATDEIDAPNWVAMLAERRRGIAALSALEATVLPIPLEAVLVPLMIAQPMRALSVGLWALLGCMIGSALFFVAGAYLADPVILPALEWMGMSDEFAQMQDRLQEGSFFLAIFLIAISPTPMQLATLGAGVVGVPWLPFLLAVAASRGLRYLGLGALAHLLGPKLQDLRIPLWALLAPALALAALAVFVL